jgi:hypothetical protein
MQPVSKKEVDIVTPNGFGGNFMPPEDQFAQKRAGAREKLRKVSEAVLGNPVKRCDFCRPQRQV